MTDELKQRLIWSGVALALGGAIGAIAVRRSKTLDDDDRPTIIVRNGSILFETQPPPTAPDPLDWDNGSGNWRPVQANAKKVKHYVVHTLEGTNTCRLPPSAAVVLTFKVTENREEEFTIETDDDQPQIRDKGLLQYYNSNKKLLSYGSPNEGRISKVTVLPSGRSCEFTTNTGVVFVQPQH